MANGHGGARRGAGRPMGRRNLRPHGTLLAVERAEEGLIPVKFEGDSLDFLRDTSKIHRRIVDYDDRFSVAAGRSRHGCRSRRSGVVGLDPLGAGVEGRSRAAGHRAPVFK